jgi:hypothetical protein
LFTLNGAKTVEKIVLRLSGLEVIEQGTQRHSRATKHRDASLNFRIAFDESRQFVCAHREKLARHGRRPIQPRMNTKGPGWIDISSVFIGVDPWLLAWET